MKNRRAFLKAAGAVTTLGALKLPMSGHSARPAMDHEPLGWKPHAIRQGAGTGGWVLRTAEYQFLHRGAGRYVFPFGVAQMDSGEIILVGAWHDGKVEKPVIAFSRDRGRSWTGFESIEGAEGRPMMLAYMGKGNLTFQANSVRYFSGDYGRTWPNRIPVPPASNGGFWACEGNPLVDRDAQGMATRIAKLGCNFGEKGRWDPREPTIEFLRWSRDGGQTWTGETMPKAWRWQVEYGGKTYHRSVNEGSLVRAANGWLVAALRTDLPPRYFDVPYDDSLEGLGVSVSRDEGATWSPVQVLYDAGRHHPHLLRMPNDDIVMTVIARVDVQDGTLASYRRGCEAIVSRDNGRTWDLPHKYILDEYEFYDGAKWYNGECGHLYSALLDDGFILTCYGKYLTKGASLIRWKPT